MNIFIMLFITVLTFIIGMMLIKIGLKIYRFFQMKELDKY